MSSGNDKANDAQSSSEETSRYVNSPLYFQLKCFQEKHNEEFAKMICINGLPFSFGENVGFNNYRTKFLDLNEKFSNEEINQELAKMICVDDLPFDFGESKSFIGYCKKYINPNIKCVSKDTIENMIYPLYTKGKKELQDLFSKFDGKVSICCEIWNDSNSWQDYNYLCMTCHWVDNEWKIQKRVIAFCVFENGRSIDNTFEIIRKTIKKFRLVDKIFSISFDHSDANSFDKLQEICRSNNVGGNFFDIRSTCHVFNLCIEDSLKALDFVIDPIKKATIFFHCDPYVRNWGKFCKANNKTPIGFPMSIPTHWNTTYDLLDQVYEYRELLDIFITTNLPEVTLSPEIWDTCGKYLDILKVFNNAICVFSRVYDPTSHLFLFECLSILAALRKHENDIVLKQPIEAMKRKLSSHFKFIPKINLVALVFYPKCKLDGLNDLLSQYYSFLNIDDIDISLIVSQVRKLVVDLYTEFRNTTDDSVSELDRYLTTTFEFHDDSIISKDFPILEWWSQRAGDFPTLSMIAKKILAAPVSITSIEEAFSTRDNIIEEVHSTYYPWVLKAQVCVRDWTKAELRKQEETMERDVDELFDLTTDEEEEGDD